MRVKLNINSISVVLYALFIFLTFGLTSCVIKHGSTEYYKSYSEVGENIVQAFQKGVQFGNQGQHRDALEQFNIVVKLDPDFAEGYRNAGLALVYLDQVDQAIPYFERAIRLDPQFAIAYINFAIAQSLIGQIEAGLESYRQAIQIAPELANKWSHVEENLLDLSDNFVSAQELISPIRMPGFLIKPPQGNRWQMRNQSKETNIVFERPTGRGKEHTIIASASFVNKTSQSTLEKAVKQTLEQFEGWRYENFNYEINNIVINGMVCRKLSFAVEDKGVSYAHGKKFLMNGVVIYYRHPLSSRPSTILELPVWTSLILELSYSQRYLPPWQPISLDNEIDVLFDSVEFKEAKPMDYMKIFGFPIR